MKPSNALQQCDSDAQRLILGCKHGLDQCAALVQQLSDSSFTYVEESNSSIGCHLRHILDRYQCFFSGLNSGCVNYDERKRDKSIESNLEAASFAIASATRRIEDLENNSQNSIKVQESVHHLIPQVLIESTVDRELMSLISHTTHHLAIIALIAKGLGYNLGSDFGKAPSTIVYERK